MQKAASQQQGKIDPIRQQGMGCLWLLPVRRMLRSS
jgi:hypothetical protein